jgi:hypothetical protein
MSVDPMRKVSAMPMNGVPASTLVRAAAPWLVPLALASA